MGGLAELRAILEGADQDLEMNQDTFRIELTGKLYELMEIESVTKSDLARKMGKSKSTITRLLSGDRNMTVDKVTEIAHHMNHIPIIEFQRLGVDREKLAALLFSERKVSSVRMEIVTDKRTVRYSRDEIIDRAFAYVRERPSVHEESHS